MTRRTLTLFVLAALWPNLACSSDGAMDVPPDVPPDASDAMFDPDHVLRIAIDMAPADWDELRMQTRSFFDVLGSSCLEAPPLRPFSYFPATVSIDGDVIDQIGVRKKGFFGSLSTTKPSLKLKFGEYVADQEYSGLSRMTLNNAISDGSYVKQCIGYDLFAKAGIPSPRCSFATVEVNGQDLGLFVHVESIKKRFIGRHFVSNDGNLYEGALSDFRPGWVETFQKKTNTALPDRADLDELVRIMELPDNVADDVFLAELERVVDVDEFITVWASELLMMHADGYARNTNNFYLYNDPTTGRLSFIPWGIDSILFNDTVLPWESQLPPATVWAEGVLARRLYQIPETRARYVARLRELLDTVWNEADILAEIERMEALITPHVTGDVQAFQGSLQQVRDFVSARRSQLEAELGSDPAWDQPLREPWCVPVVGTVTGAFDTTWDTLQAEDPFMTGTATADIALDNTPITVTQTGSASGIDTDSGNPAVRIVALTAPTEIHVVQVVVNDPNLFVPGASIAIDWTDAAGYVVKIDFATGMPVFSVIGLIGDGTLDLGQASTVAGEPVSGSLSGTIFESIF